MLLLKNWIFLTFILGCFAEPEPEVEIAEFFGTVLFQQGISQSITCSVYDPLQYGIITWKVGDRIVETSARVTDGEDGEKLQVLQFTPTLQDNNKKLTCEYGERGEQVYSDHITMGIYVMDLPSDTITPGLINEGDPIQLEVTAGLFPAPEPSDILWEVRQPGGELVAELGPGGQDTFGLYSAGDIQVLSDNLYKFTMDIGVVDKTEVSNQHTLTIATSGIKKTVQFFLSLKMNEEEGVGDTHGGEDAVAEMNEENMKDEEPEDGVISMGLSLVIIIGIIVVFIICCIIYCIYRRRSKTRSKDSKTYQPVKTDTHGQPV